MTAVPKKASLWVFAYSLILNPVRPGMKRTTSERAELEDIADSDRKRLKTTDNVKEKKRRRKKKKKHSIIDPNFRKNKLDVSRDDQSVQNITVNTGLPVQSPTPDLAEELRITTQVSTFHSQRGLALIGPVGLGSA